MSFNNSPFYIYPQVEATYDLNLSAAFLRASCVTFNDSVMMDVARRFHQSLQRDQVENWRDQISLADLINDRSIKASSTQKLLRHISLTPSLSLVSSFVANREGLWRATTRMAQLVRRSSRNDDEYNKLMAKFRESSEDVWSLIIDTKMKIYRDEIGEFRPYVAPEKDGTVPHVEPDQDINSKTKELLSPVSEIGRAHV